MQTDLQREALYDQHMGAPEGYEWTDDDMQMAKDCLHYDIVFGAKCWDENLEGYRLDLLLELESILLRAEDDKLGRMNDATYKAVSAYCDEEVETNPNKYCEVYCGE